MIGRNQPPFIRSTSIADCGPTCIKMIVGALYGEEATQQIDSGRFSARGTTVGELAKVLNSIGISARAARASLEQIKQRSGLAIAIFDESHYVLIYKIGPTHVHFVDPNEGYKVESIIDAENRFSGIAVLIDRPSYKPVTEEFSGGKLSLRELFRHFSNIRTAIVQVLILMVFNQVLLLASPLVVSIIIDRAIPQQDMDLVRSLAFVLFAFMISNVAITIVRQRAQLRLSTEVAITLFDTVVRRALGISITWFERRGVGDILSRIQSVAPINQLITQNSAQVVLDALFLIAVLAVMSLIDAFLAFISLCALAAMVVSRLVLTHFERREEEKAIVLRARQQTHLIETIHGIVPVKASNREAARHASWLDITRTSAKANVKVSNISFYNEAIQSLISGSENILVVSIAAYLVYTNELSLGSMFAFLIYKGQFINKGASMIGQLSAIKMTETYVDRLSDIWREPTDPSWQQSHDTAFVFNRMRLKKVGFRYGDHGADILHSINLEFRCGDWVAFTGKSGQGKTTLLKVLIGLVEHSSGDILLNQTPVERTQLRELRNVTGSVQQGEYVFSGRICDIIAGFSPKMDIKRVEWAARIAMFRKDVEAMPMKYKTEVGEGGALLSGGQRQRLQIAAAVYRNPQVLILDEATSQLDPSTEEAIYANLRRLPITLLAAAHRKETLDLFDVRYEVSDGELIRG